jgi:endoplasmic reticulum junction formation protein lunapark
VCDSIYVLRTVVNAYYSFRLDTLETRLKDRQAERAKTIQKLKDATKYDSTLELLEKYGGAGEKRNKPKNQKGGDEGPIQEEGGSRKKHRQSIDSGHLTGRTHLPPPPTANIQRPSTASGVPPSRQGQLPTHREAQPSPEHQPIEEFAPNAGPLPPAYSHQSQYDTNTGPPRWYDRMLDLMLGEDETSPKNRIVLICHKCRLVNGQAPPGVKNVAELGTWKCMGCRATNGEMDEGKKIIQEVLGNRNATRDENGSAEERDSDQSSDMVKVEPDGDDNTQSDADTRRNMQEFRAKKRDKKSQMVP